MKLPLCTKKKKEKQKPFFPKPVDFNILETYMTFGV